ncbi:hypothetical protein EV643_106211 [Kribbella sp. VKM Ac-2527]|uniref:Uncharacterized protein n=1 Tax=Kribbella caucasensis TaxID=2512215 RepID=A0A4R6KF65_9ACTN|nr:hypothetical protein [Kribbella sp. VKM Ac-2527]TDO49242.1 hypothetical protein EV643_106211 [Kribbella sp. VKM Ac-2527]
MAERFDLDAIEADDALLDLLAAGGESAWDAAEHDPALKLLAGLRLAVEVEDELPVETIDDADAFLARCAALNPVTDPFARKVAARGLALGVAAVAALSVSGVAAAVNGDPLAPYEKVIEKVVEGLRPETSFPKEQLDGMPVVDKTKIVRVAKNYKEKQENQLREDQIAERNGEAKQGTFDADLDGLLGPTKTLARPQPPQLEKPTVIQQEIKPVVKPTSEPTDQPTSEPTDEPTGEPTDQPTSEPTDQPTSEPTDQPTDEPTSEPTDQPTSEPTDPPTATPTPTEEPSNGEAGEQNEVDGPGEQPSGEPTQLPSTGEGAGGGQAELPTGIDQPAGEETKPVEEAKPVEETKPTTIESKLAEVVEPVLPTPTGSPVELPDRLTEYFGTAFEDAAKHSNGKHTLGWAKAQYAKGKHSSGQYAEGKHAAVNRAHGSMNPATLRQILSVLNNGTTNGATGR